MHARAPEGRGAVRVTIASVVWSQFEQYGAIHNLPFATEANGFKGLDAVLKVNSPPFVKTCSA